MAVHVQVSLETLEREQGRLEVAAETRARELLASKDWVSSRFYAVERLSARLNVSHPTWATADPPRQPHPPSLCSLAEASPAAREAMVPNDISAARKRLDSRGEEGKVKSQTQENPIKRTHLFLPRTRGASSLR